MKNARLALLGISCIVLAAADDSITIPMKWSAQGDRKDALFGSAAAPAGDVNRDGFDDFIIGAPGYSIGPDSVGAAFLYYGAPDGPASTPDWTAIGTEPGAMFGLAVASAGDVNGDGFGDILIASPGASFEDAPYAGAVHAYFGGPGGLSPAPDWTAKSNQADSWFGNSVAGAGDVNGDGFDDIAIGAILYNTGTASWPDNDGLVVVYHGSAEGLPTTSAPPERVSPTPAVEMTGGAPYLQFGCAVSPAGDVNQDGFADLVVGGRFWGISNPPGADPSGNGAAFVFHGSDAGLPAAPSWRKNFDKAKSDFGTAVACGDVNHDGFSDVVVGAPRYDNGSSLTDAGAVFAFFGGPEGLSDSSGWSVVGDKTKIRLGSSVACPGDVNDDGIDDILAGAPLRDGDAWQSGAAHLFLGHAGSGPSPTSDWTFAGSGQNVQAGACVSAAGDVQGDGIRDFVVGTPRSSQTYALEGSASLFAIVGDAPFKPASLAQLNLGNGSVIPVGATATRFGATLKARVVDPHDGPVALHVEIKAVGVAFDGAGVVTSPMTASGSFVHISQELATGPFHWRGRATGSGGESAWVSFGWNDETAADFVVPAHHPPSLAGLVQSGPLGGGTSDRGIPFFDREARLEGRVFHPDEVPVRLDVEVRALGLPFTGSPTMSSDAADPALPVGLVAPLAPGVYRWKARVGDGFTAPTAWMSFGNNPDDAPDFEVRYIGGSAGASGCSQSTGTGPEAAMLIALAALVAARGRIRSL